MPLLIGTGCALRDRQSMRGAILARPLGRRGRVAAPLMRLVKATEEPDQHKNRNRHPKQPQKQIASHRRFSFCRRELDTLRQVPDTLLQCGAWNEMRWLRIDSCHGKRAIEVANQRLRGKNYESESEPETWPAGWPTAAGWSAEAGSRWSAAARWPAKARSRWPAAAGWPAVKQLT